MRLTVEKRWAMLGGIFMMTLSGVLTTARWVAVPWWFVAGMFGLGIAEAVAKRWPVGRGPAARIAFLAAWAGASSVAYGGFIAESAAAAVQSASIALAALII